MLIDEESAKFKFCPLGRGAVPIKPGSDKFAAGVNMSPNGPLTTCEGSRCMLWETVEVKSRPQQIPCKKCEGKRGLVEDCSDCKGAGTTTINIPVHVGFCGAGFQGPLASGLVELNKTLAELFKKVPVAPQP